MPIRGLGHAPSPLKKTNMTKKILKVLAVLALSAHPLSDQVKETAPTKGYEIYEGEYVSTLLCSNLNTDLIGKAGYYNLANFIDEDDPDHTWFFFSVNILESGIAKSYFQFEGSNSKDCIDWEASKLLKPNDKYLFVSGGDENYTIYFKKPLKTGGVGTDTKKYLTATNPALSFAGGYDGFIPSFSYTSISGNKSYFESITSVSSLIQGQVWKSADVSSLNIEKDGYIFQYYYVYASVMAEQKMYDVWLIADAKSKDGKKMICFNIKELVFVDLNLNDRKVGSYDFPHPVSTLEVVRGYYDIIRSSGAYGITDTMMTYEQGYKDGQGNPTFKSFIVSAFEACSAFFSLPVLGKNITVGTLIGSFIGLGALFLLIRLFR